MTDTESGTAAGTAVEQVALGALALVKSGDPWTLGALSKILAGPIPETAPDVPLPEAAPAASLTDKFKAALKKLPSVFASVMPTEPRKLEEAELTRITDEYLTLEAVADEIVKRQEAIKETIRHHQDAVALENGKARDSDRIADGAARGHLLAAGPGEPFKTPVKGFSDPWRQQRTSGAVTISEADLYRMFDEMQITRAEFLACTRQVRKFDEMCMSAFIRKDPQRGLEILRSITKTSAPGASLYSPKK